MAWGGGIAVTALKRDRNSWVSATCTEPQDKERLSCTCVRRRETEVGKLTLWSRYQVGIAEFSQFPGKQYWLLGEQEWLNRKTVFCLMTKNACDFHTPIQRKNHFVQERNSQQSLYCVKKIHSIASRHADWKTGTLKFGGGSWAGTHVQPLRTQKEMFLVAIFFLPLRMKHFFFPLYSLRRQLAMMTGFCNCKYKSTCRFSKPMWLGLGTSSYF